MKNKTELILLVVAVIFLSHIKSFCQDKSVIANKKMLMHKEEMDAPYLPNEFNNKKVSPAQKYLWTDKFKSTGSSIFTNQVNINSNGQNIVGDAANEPNIAINPLDGNIMVIGWRQFDNVGSSFRQAGWSYTSDAGQNWTYPGTIESGVFRSDPVLDFDSSGNFYYNSLALGFFCKVFKSTDGGVNWDTGVDAKGGDKQWMAIDRTSGVGSGNIYSFWTSYYSTCLPGFFTRSTDNGNSFEDCSVVNDSSYWGTMAVGNNGELFMAGGGWYGGIVVEKSTNAQISSSTVAWDSAISVYMDGDLNYGVSVNPGGLLGQVSIDVDRSIGAGYDNVYVLASMTRLSNSDTADVMFSRSVDGGLTWSAPIRVNDDVSTTNVQWMATMSVAPNGRIDAAWLDTRDNISEGDSSALYYSYSYDQGNTWSANEKLSQSFDPHVGYPVQQKMGDYFDMISDNTGAHLAWANTLNGEEDVYYSRIIPQGSSVINEIYNNNMFTVFPNPSKGEFVISIRANKSIQTSERIEIYNILGEKVNLIKPTSSTINVDISGQPSGIYILKIDNKNGIMAVKKIIKE